MNMLNDGLVLYRKFHTQRHLIVLANLARIDSNQATWPNDFEWKSLKIPPVAFLTNKRSDPSILTKHIQERFIASLRCQNTSLGSTWWCPQPTPTRKSSLTTWNLYWANKELCVILRPKVTDRELGSWNTPSKTCFPAPECQSGLSSSRTLLYNFYY